MPRPPLWHHRMSSRACFIPNTKWVSRMPAQPLGNATALGDTLLPRGSGERDRDRKRGRGGREWGEAYLPSAIIELKIVLHKNANCHISCTFLFSFGSHCKLFAAYPVCGIYKALPSPSLSLCLSPSLSFPILLHFTLLTEWQAICCQRCLPIVVWLGSERSQATRNIAWVAMKLWLNCALLVQWLAPNEFVINWNASSDGTALTLTIT